MRFVTIEHESVERVGILDGETIRVLEAGVSLLGLLGGDGSRLGDAGERALRSPDLVVPIADAHLRAPVPRPPSVRDYMTFEQHFEGVARTAGPKAAVPPSGTPRPRSTSPTRTRSTARTTTWPSHPDARRSTWNSRSPSYSVQEAVISRPPKQSGVSPDSCS